MGKKQRSKASKSGKNDDILAAALAAGSGGLFKPLPPNKRHELNQIVDKLLYLCSNFAKDAPTTPQGLLEEHMEIRALLKTVQELEACNLNRPLLGSRVAHVEEMVRWIEGHEGVVKGVKAASFGAQGLGLKVSEKIPKGDVVIQIPRKVIMSVDTAKDSEIGRLIEKDPMLKTMGNVALALHLLLEKTSPASFWEPYINTLPSKYDTVLFFSPEDFQELKGSPAFDDGLKQFKYVARQYAYFYQKFQTTILKDYFTFDEYRWAVSTVMTRQNQIPSLHEEEQFVNALIPLWDLANHEEGEMSTDYDDERHAVKCMANRDFEPEQQFTIFYGVRSNHDFLVHNGFVVDDNPHDTLVIKLGIGKNDSLGEGKKDILARLQISPHGHFTLAKGQQPIDKSLLAFLRVMCLSSQEQIDAWANDDKIKGLLNEEPLEDAQDLDKKAYQYMLTRATLLLRSYPTSLETDMDLKKKESELSTIRRFCLNLRIGEKQILNQTVKYCQNKLD